MLDTLKAAPFFLCFSLCILLHHSPEAQASNSGGATSLSGYVRDLQGQPIAGAQVQWVEGQASMVTKTDGSFVLPTLSIRSKGGHLRGISFKPSRHGLVYRFEHSGLTRLEIFAVNGQKVFAAAVTAQSGELTLNDGPLFLRVASRTTQAWFRLSRNTSGWQAQAVQGALPTTISKAAALTKVASPNSDGAVNRYTLDITATGFSTRRLAFYLDTAIAITLLPAEASLKQKLTLMMSSTQTGQTEDSLGLKIAWLESTGDGSHTLHYADLQDLDTLAGRNNATVAPSAWKAKSFADSRGATLPSLSPDGQFIAYETGREAATLTTSRIFIQPVDGARFAGPEYPATNPRFFRKALGPDQMGDTTLLLWSTSGRASGYDDTTSRTLARVFAAGSLRPAEETLTLATGSYNAGLSVDGKFLAAGFPRGLILDRVTQNRRHMHVYPGSSLGQDSLQVCNASISQDPAHPDRMLFIDFGVFTSPGYPNLVRPATYAQHRMILFADYTSEAPGRIVDFIDTPKDALAADKSWEDPEWSTHPDFAIAATRLDSGDDITQPDVYLIRLSTHETVKLFSGTSFYMPVAWVGQRKAP